MSKEPHQVALDEIRALSPDIRKVWIKGPQL